MVIPSYDVQPEREAQRYSCLFLMSSFLHNLYLNSMRAQINMMGEHCRTVTTSLTNFAEPFVPGCSVFTLITLVIGRLVPQSRYCFSIHDECKLPKLID